MIPHNDRRGIARQHKGRGSFMTHKPEDGRSRRDFLRLAATGAPVMAVAGAMTGQAAEASEPDPTSDRMQDTAHTRAYLDSARF
jgi:hypothetical protein